MIIKLIMVGKTSHDYLQKGINDYVSRLKHYCKFEIITIPDIKNVKNFDGILIHVGNTPRDSFGCILTGYNTIKGQLTNSRKAFALLMDKYLAPARRRCENVVITVK